MKVELTFDEIEVEIVNGLTVVWFLCEHNRLYFVRTNVTLSEGESLSIKGLTGRIQVESEEE